MHNFKNFLLYEKMLFENRITDLENKYKPLIGDDIVKYFSEEDPTDNKAYLEWMLKTYTKMDDVEKENLNKLKIDPYKFFITVIKKFHNIKNNLDKEDRNIQNYNRFFLLYDKVIESGIDYSTSAIKSEGNCEIDVNNDEWLIFTPFEFNVSEKYGHNERGGTNWCTCYDEDYFFEYFCPDGGVTMIINKLDYTKDVALQKDSAGTVVIWNSDDKKELHFYREEQNKLINYLENREGFEFIIDYFENNKIDYFPDIDLDKIKEEWISNQNITQLMYDEDYEEYFDMSLFVDDHYYDWCELEESGFVYVDLDDFISFVSEETGEGVDYLEDRDTVDLIDMIDFEKFFSHWFNENSETYGESYIDNFHDNFDKVDYISDEFMEYVADEQDEQELIIKWYKNK